MTTSSRLPSEGIYAIGPGMQIMAGSFAPNGSSAVAATSVKGKGFTVAYTSTGLFRVTLLAPYRALIAGFCNIHEPTVTDNVAKFLTTDVTAGTVDITVEAAGSAANVTADAAARISFCLFLATSEINR